MRQALKFQQEGKQWVVDVDLKQFFDEVDHDILMARLGRKVKFLVWREPRKPVPGMLQLTKTLFYTMF